MSKYSHVIWDWNGTLLDDVAWCMKTINALLTKRGLPALDTIEAYHGVFGFPIIDYYRRAGFDFQREPFETLAAEYIAIYHSSEREVALFPGAREILSAFQRRGVRQVILSASELGNLLTQMQPFALDDYFDEILGISDIFAASKVDIGRAYIKRAKPAKALLVGDTVHDKEVADALGIACVLVASGHQSKAALLSSGAPVVSQLLDITKIVLGSTAETPPAGSPRG